VYKSQDKQSELAAIDKLLSSPAISSELLRLFCSQYPLFIPQQQQQQQQQQQACDEQKLSGWVEFTT